MYLKTRLHTLLRFKRMDAEFNQTVCGRWPATGPLGLGVPKFKALHQKKFGVQHDSLESGAAVIQPPLQLRGNLGYFLFFLSFNLYSGLRWSDPRPASTSSCCSSSRVLCFFAGLAARPCYRPCSMFLCWPGREVLVLLALAAATGLVDCNSHLQTVLCD